MSSQSAEIKVLGHIQRALSQLTISKDPAIKAVAQQENIRISSRLRALFEAEAAAARETPGAVEPAPAA